MIGPLAYIGGKRRLAARLVPLIPPHVTYVEPFAGGAQVFFHKPRSRVEILNDLDGELVNFLRICREHPWELLRTLEWLVPSRSVFAQFAEQPAQLLTDVQRAARFLYLQKNAFGGRIVGRHFHACVTKPSNYNPVRLERTIRATALRLRLVQLENAPYEEVLARYDRPTTVFYLDPPYVGAKLYRFNLDDGQYSRMAAQLASLKGQFLLSINDTPIARQAFHSFDIRQIQLVYTSTLRVPLVSELIVANFSLPANLNSARIDDEPQPA